MLLLPADFNWQSGGEEQVKVQLLYRRVFTEARSSTSQVSCGWFHWVHIHQTLSQGPAFRARWCMSRAKPLCVSNRQGHWQHSANENSVCHYNVKVNHSFQVDFLPSLNTLSPGVNDDVYDSQNMFSCFEKSIFHSRELI